MRHQQMRAILEDAHRVATASWSAGSPLPLSHGKRRPESLPRHSHNKRLESSLVRPAVKAAEDSFHYPHLCNPRVRERIGAQELVILSEVCVAKNLATHRKPYTCSRVPSEQTTSFFVGVNARWHPLSTLSLGLPLSGLVRSFASKTALRMTKRERCSDSQVRRWNLWVMERNRLPHSKTLARLPSCFRQERPIMRPNVMHASP